MNRNRWIVLSLWILSVVGISFFGGAVSYGLFWMLTLLPAFLYLYLIFVLREFRIFQQLGSNYVVSRSPVSYYFTLQNESFFTFSKIKVTFYDFGVDYGDLDRDREYELMPHSGYKTTTGIICKYRGEYYIGIEKIIITDFLRLFSITYKNPEPLKVNILPAIEYPSDNLLEAESVFSNSVSHKNPAIRDILVRPYHERDSLRNINWKASAKMQKLMAANMISEEQNSVSIYLNTKRVGNQPEEYLPLEDRLLTQLISIVLYFITRYIIVEVYYISQGTHHIALKSMDQFDDFYTEICGVIFDPAYDVRILSPSEEAIVLQSNDTEEVSYD